MRFARLEIGVPGKTEEVQPEKKKGGTGDLIVDNPGKVDCNGPAGVSTRGFGVEITVWQGDWRVKCWALCSSRSIGLSAIPDWLNERFLRGFHVRFRT